VRDITEISQCERYHSVTDITT